MSVSRKPAFPDQDPIMESFVSPIVWFVWAKPLLWQSIKSINELTAIRITVSSPFFTLCFDGTIEGLEHH